MPGTGKAPGLATVEDDKVSSSSVDAVVCILVCLSCRKVEPRRDASLVSDRSSSVSPAATAAAVFNEGSAKNRFSRPGSSPPLLLLLLLLLPLLLDYDEVMETSTRSSAKMQKVRILHGVQLEVLALSPFNHDTYHDLLG